MELKNVVVSRNYLDWNSPFKWLVRRKGDPIKDAIACKQVTARGVQFGLGVDGEVGFGCGSVANCEEVGVADVATEVADLPGLLHIPDSSVEMRFDGFSFYITKDYDRKYVSACKAMILFEDGSMRAVMESSGPAPAPTKEQEEAVPA